MKKFILSCFIFLLITSCAKVSKTYTALDRSDEDMAVAQASSSGFFATKSNERSMMIACKK